MGPRIAIVLSFILAATRSAAAGDGSAAVAASPDPLATPNLHPFKHANFALYAARDPALARDAAASTASGLKAFRTRTGPAVSGYLEPSEGVIGRCGTKYYAAVPLDSGSAAGFAGWLVYYPGRSRHVAVIAATEGLDFHGRRIRASSFIYDPKKDTATAVHRVDSYKCRGVAVTLVESHVVPVP